MNYFSARQTRLRRMCVFLALFLVAACGELDEIDIDD